MAYEVQTIANNFLDLAKRDNELLDPMKIQKLIYLAHGWNLAFKGEPLINQAVQAWPYGPVIAELYHDFKKFRGNPITEKAPVRDCGEETDLNANALLESVWSKYRPFSGIQLSVVTHEPGNAWDRTMKTSGPYSVIPNSLIKEEFSRRKQRAA